jgi:hypothetical protein
MLNVLTNFLRPGAMPSREKGAQAAYFVGRRAFVVAEPAAVPGFLVSLVFVVPRIEECFQVCVACASPETGARDHGMAIRRSANQSANDSAIVARVSRAGGDEPARGQPS